MQLCCSIVFLLLLSTVSVKSYCLDVTCKTGFTEVIRNGEKKCKRIVQRSIKSENCRGRNKIYIDSNIIGNPGPVYIDCPEGYVFNGDMQCQLEGWERNSGPWETHHYTVNGRNLVLAMKQSDFSIRYRSLSLD